MGEQDYERLYPIYRFATDFCKLANIPFSFKVDSGKYETAIIFNELTKKHRRPKSNENWDNVKYPEIMIVPDITSYENMIAIEHEEETGKRRPGARMARKGHGHEGDMPTKRDERRNDLYKKNKFHVLRLWESNVMWRITLAEFLISCYRQKIIDSM